MPRGALQPLEDPLPLTFDDEPSLSVTYYLFISLSYLSICEDEMRDREGEVSLVDQSRQHR